MILIRRRSEKAKDSAEGLEKQEEVPEPEPEPEAKDQQAYREIVAFALDYVVPACDAIEDALKRICGSQEIAGLVSSGLRSDSKAGGFLVQYNRLLSGLRESPDPIIKFRGIIDCIAALEKDDYRNFRERIEELAGSANINLEADPKLGLVWHSWRIRHKALVKAYETVKRDPRFGKLFRPARPSRWGEPSGP
jgi:hypothetical protein